MHLQAIKPDLVLASTMYPCTQILASKLDAPIINYFPTGPFDPFFTTLWRGSNRRGFLPNPLSYNPQVDMEITSQHMVSALSVGLKIFLLAKTAACLKLCCPVI